MKKNDPQYIGWLLTMNDRAVERAMVVLYERQEECERASGTTTKSNGRGFSAYDASKGTYYAKWVLSGKRLTGRFLEHARTMSKRYIRQLAEAATERMEAQAAEDLVAAALEREAIQAESN